MCLFRQNRQTIGPRVTFWRPTFWSVCAYTVMVDHFLAAEALARFNLSISSRSEAEHLDRTAPISESFLRSIAASAAPSRSLAEEEGWFTTMTGDVGPHLCDYITAAHRVT